MRRVITKEVCVKPGDMRVRDADEHQNAFAALIGACGRHLLDNVGISAALQSTLTVEHAEFVHCQPDFADGFMW